MSPIRVVLVDDQEMIRGGLRLIVDSDPGMTVVAEAGNGMEALTVAAAVVPDVVVMDIRMPVLDGIEATGRMLAAARAPAVLILTTFDDDEYVFGALRSGAAGFLLKDSRPDELIAAIRAVNDGGALAAPALTRRLVERWSALEEAALRTRAPLIPPVDLTPREGDILMGLARGWSNRELAGHLHLSEATVKSHVNSLLAKLGLRSRVQAVIYAYESGLVTAGQGPPPPDAAPLRPPR